MLEIKTFMDASNVKSLTTIDENITEKNIKVALHIAQITHIKPALDAVSKTLYNELQNAVNNSNPTDTQIDILNQISLPLAHWTHYQLIVDLTYKTKEAGVLTLNPANTNNTQIDDLKYLRSIKKATCEVLTEQLQKYLIDNNFSDSNKDNPNNYNNNFGSLGIYIPPIN